MLAVTSVTLDGVAIANADVLADITIRHGRTGYFDSPSASTCQLTILGVERSDTKSIRLGRELKVFATDGATIAPRFTGRNTDASLDGDELTVIAVGYLSTLSGYVIGTGNYPEEAWTARVTRAFTDAGLAARLVLQAPNADPVLWARTAAPVTLDSYLSELCEAIGATVADLPDGRILVQPISYRSLTAPVDLSPSEVAYAPQWLQDLPGCNRVTVAYGNPNAQAFLTREDAASIALYGPRPASITTPLRDVVSAASMAEAIIARQAYARWTTPETTLIIGRRLSIGDAVKLRSLPASAPFDPWYPMLEGWTDSIVSDGDGMTWTMALMLSDAMLSGVAMRWMDVPAPLTWATVNPTLQWRDALSPGDLT